MKQLLVMLILTVVAIGCARDSGQSTPTVSSVNDGPEQPNNQNDMDLHPTELLAKLRAFDGENNADSILTYLAIDLSRYKKIETGQRSVFEHKLNDIFFLRRSTNGTTFQNGKPVWIYCTQK